MLFGTYFCTDETLFCRAQNRLNHFHTQDILEASLHSKLLERKKTYMNQETGFCLYICFKWKSHLKIWLLAWLHHYCNNASWQWNLIWFIPLKLCNICQSNAFLGWAAELSMWIGGYSPPVISLKKHDILAIEPYLYERTKHSHNSLAPLLHYLGHKLL